MWSFPHTVRPRSIAVSFVVLALVVAGSVGTASGAPTVSLKVMTRNLYLGADLSPVFTATPETLFQEVAQVWGIVQATDFPERAEALADEIAEADPHIVGLQEVELWRSQTPADGPFSRAATVEYDFLELLLDALEARGRSYAAAATVTNVDTEVPGLDPLSPNFLTDYRLTDRDVILARTDLPARVFSVANAQGANFESNLVLSGLLGPVEVLRGWTSVDATIQGRTVRVVNTHLERLFGPVQEVQGLELLEGPADTTLPVVLLGDLNSAAGGVGAVPGQSDTETYANMLGAGFADVWTQARGAALGLTCCHAETLTNPTPTLTERIDVVLVRDGLRGSSAVLVGEEADDRTPSGLWPSDHAGLRAVIRVA